MNFFVSFFIWLLLTPLGFFVTLLPRRLELVLGNGLGLFWFLFSKKRKKVASENISRCFPDKDHVFKENLLKENYKHYGILILEILHLFSPIPGHYRSYSARNSKIEGLENWKEAHSLGRGVLFVSSHLANWELMVACGSMSGITLTMVTKLLKPKWLHQKIEKSRLSVGVKGAYEPRTLPHVMKALRRGESVGFVMDQYAGPPIGIKVPFFGVKVGTLAAVGTLAYRTGAQVIPVNTYRDLDGVVHVVIEKKLALAEIEDAEITARLAQKVEGWVRQNPSQWLWIHRRFKNLDPKDSL